MLQTYEVAALTAATAASTDQAIAQIYNPSTTVPIWVKEIHCFKLLAGGADILKIRRSSARGTQTATKAAGIANHVDRLIAPPSTWTLDVTFSAQPTADGEFMDAIIAPASVGTGGMWIFDDPKRILPGAALTIISGLASLPACWVKAKVWE